jgi:PAS domain S-box-containing protein
MRPLAVFDIIALLATIAALIILVQGRQRALQRDSKVLFAGLFTLTLFLNLSNVLEWTGITGALDPFEDFIEILVPVLWFLIFYVFLQELATRELWRNTHYYRTLLDSLHEDIIVIDRDYQITDINNNFLVTSGFNRLEVIGRHCFEVLHGYDEPCHYHGENCKLDEVFQTGQPCSCRHEHLKKDGSKNWVDILASPIKNKDNKVSHVIEAIRDITDLVAVENAIKESEEKYRLVIEDANDAIFIVQDESVKFSNPKAKEFTGYTVEELTSVSFFNFIHPEDRAMVLERHHGRIKGKKQPESYSFRIINKAGEILWVQLNVALITWDNKPATLNILRDITPQKKMEAQLQTAQKMEAIGTLAGGIAHDFNNILFGVIGYTEIALSEIEKDTTLYENLQEVLLAGERAKDLVKQILTFSRQTEQDRKPVQVKTIVKEVLKLLRASLPTTIEIRQEIKSDSLVLADPTQIHQILMNLCTNAEHAMRDKGGVLDIMLSDVELDRDFAAGHPDIEPGTFARLTVSDSGHGIPSHSLDRIFDPFFTTKNSSEGTGMGLSVVHGIVGSNGGTITVSSESGQGSTFDVYLPVIERSVDPQIIDEEFIPTGTERILFVDDEQTIVNIGQQILESLGYDVTTRTSSKDALELFKTQANTFDLVITDMTMPKMTGDILTRELIRIKPDIPVILCTGFSAKMDDQKAKTQGIKAFILKPIVKREIAEIIRKVLDGKNSDL